VSTDTHVSPLNTEAPELLVDINFRFDQFLVMTAILGAQNDAERAVLIQMDPKTLRRARDGVIGHEFMGKTVAGLRRHSDKLAEYGITVSLDALFEVREATAGLVAA
jgi:hypothetical protein